MEFYSKESAAAIAGIPVELLTGKTVEENIALAEQLRAFKNAQPELPKSTREQFAEWLYPPQRAHEATQEAQREAPEKYPAIHDGGETEHYAPQRTSDSFAEWFNRAL